ncbi:hypothetical protein SAMN04490182_3253 [Pseudomonas cedrina]|uniref:Uncharacterized protein n=1 Tax=Pseudomonas cedrina TaxID=651740 RepID=A0ABY0URR2_PSECE|nr:hypothetical protein SAMN04490182_3253 [Pseudomonas cedrina]
MLIHMDRCAFEVTLGFLFFLLLRIDEVDSLNLESSLSTYLQ